MEVLDVPCCLLEIVFSGKTSVHFVDVAAALQWDHMNVFTERTLVWVLAGHARFIFLLLSHLFPSLPSHLSAHQSAGSVVRTAHSARRGLGDVLAALRTTPGVRQPLLENGHFEAHLDILLNFFFCGENPSLANSLRRFFLFFVFSPDPFFRW